MIQGDKRLVGRADQKNLGFEKNITTIELVNISINEGDFIILWAIRINQ